MGSVEPGGDVDRQFHTAPSGMDERLVGHGVRQVAAEADKSFRIALQQRFEEFYGSVALFAGRSKPNTATDTTSRVAFAVELIARSAVNLR